MFIAVITMFAWLALRWVNNWLYVPLACGTYNDTQTGNANAVVTQNLPANACGGFVTVTGLTSHLGGKGFSFSVAIDGGAPTVTGCKNGASQAIPIPAGSLQVVTTVTAGCAGGTAGSYSVQVNG